MPRGSKALRLGVDVLLDERLDLVRGKRVGLITNPTGVDADLVSTIERFRSQPAITLAALYGPEHGVRGNAQAGEYVPFYVDPEFQLPVFSLYGPTEKLPAEFLTDIDATMRTFDTQATGKTVERPMVDAIDVLVFDLQDVGTRVYTYIATMAYAMQAAAGAGLEAVIQLAGSDFAFHADYFDHVLGTAIVRSALEQGQPVASMVAGWESGLAEFSARREEFLLYPVST